LLRYGAGVLGAGGGLTLLAACGGGASTSVTTSAAVPTTTAGPAAATTAAASTAAATTVTATSQAAASAPPSKGGTVTLMTQTDAKQATMYQKIPAPFSAANGGAKVNIIQGGAGSTDIQQKLLLLISANTPPDVYWTHTYINSGLASLGIPVDVAPYMARDKAFDTSDMFAPSLADFNIGGKQYAFPRETTAIVMAYNKTLFQKAGIAEPAAACELARLSHRLPEADERQRPHAELGHGWLDEHGRDLSGDRPCLGKGWRHRGRAAHHLHPRPGRRRGGDTGYRRPHPQVSGACQRGRAARVPTSTISSTPAVSPWSPPSMSTAALPTPSSIGISRQCPMMAL